MKPERAIPESLRTVVFTEEEAAFIHRIMESLDVDAAVGSLEEIVQILLNATNEIRHDLGGSLFLIAAAQGISRNTYKQVSAGWRGLLESFYK